MAIINGQAKTYGYNAVTAASDAANEAIDISSALDTLSPTDVPLLTLIGRDSLRDPCTQVKHEWLEDIIRGMSATSTDTDLNNATPATVTLTLATAGDYLKFRGGAIASAVFDIVRISSPAGSEIAPVTATASNTIDVIRGGFTGSTPIDHTGYTKTITIIGTAQPQGLTTVGASRTTLKTNVFNYTQIFEDSYSASATQQATHKWTNQNEREYQMGNLVKILGVQMERSLLAGYKTAPDATHSGTLGGIRSFITTNLYDKAGAALTQGFLEDALQAVWAAGAEATCAVVNATQKRRINTFLDAYRLTGYNDTKLGSTVTRYVTDFGAVDVLLDRHMLDNEVLIIDSSRIGFGPLAGRALGMTPIAPTSREAETWEYSGEYTAEVRQESAHALIINLATTGLF